MLKFRYLLIWAVIGFFSMAVLSFVIESYILKLEAMQVRSYTELAADCALQTGQGIDDFFAEPASSATITIINNDGSRSTGLAVGSWYNTSAIKGLRIKYDNGYDEYDEDDLLGWYLSKVHSTSSAHKDRLNAFKYLYDSSSGSDTSKEFYNFAKSKACLSVYTQLPLYVKDGVDAGKLEWVKVPRIALIGAYCIWDNEEDFKNTFNTTSGLNSIYGTLDNYKMHKMWQALDTNNYLNIIKSSGFLDGKEYMLTPSKVGVSYIPRELVEKIYQNNLDLLLRARKNGDLQSYSGFVDDTWAYGNDSIYQHQENKEAFNDIINNGILAVSKGTSTITGIEYRCIDIFAEKNNVLIEAVYGGLHTVGATGGGSYDMTGGIDKITAGKLKDRSPNNLMVLISGKWVQSKANSKYEIIAKVTFSADVILSHKTAIFTNWGTTYDKSVDNINDIEIRNGIDTNRATRNKKYIYTRFYDINA